MRKDSPISTGFQPKGLKRQGAGLHLATALILLLIPLCGHAQYRDDCAILYDTPVIQSMRSTVDYLCHESLKGRAAGSQGEAEAASYISNALEAIGLDVISGKEGDIFGVAREDSDTLVSRNVVAFISGCDEKLSTHAIVVGARLDNLGSYFMTVDGKQQEVCYPGANGNASGLAVLLELAKLLKTNESLCRRSIFIVGFGASNVNFAGAWYFINRSFGKDFTIDAMVNLDMVGREGEEFYAYTSSNKDLGTILENMHGELLPIYPELTAEEPYPSDHRAFYAAEIPSVFLCTGRYPEHNRPRDTPDILDFEKMEREIEYAYGLCLRLARTDNPPLFRNDIEAINKKKRNNVSNDTYAFFEVDVKPRFLNSSDPNAFLNDWIYIYVKYPQEAVDNGIQGTVQVDFIIEPTGEVTNVEIARSVSPALDAEALKVVSASPRWKPAYVKGMKVRCAMTVGVEFRLAKKGKFGINGVPLGNK